MAYDKLSNASKYAPRGGRVEFRAEAMADAIRISVRDKGLGIPEDELESVFEIFRQIDRSVEMGRRGLGIGLSLVRQLIEMHGGSVEAHSEGPEKGSELEIQIPSALEDQEKSDSTPPETLSNVSPGARRRVLLVEDELDVARALSRLIRLLGHEIRVAVDGKEAIAAAAEFRPDVVLMDIGLPKLNGYEAARAMRAEPWSQDALFFAVTGRGQAEDRRRAYDAGFDEHVTKPIDLATLREVLSRGPRRS